MFSSIQSIPCLIFAKSDVKAKIRPGVEARISCAISCASVLRDNKPNMRKPIVNEPTLHM